MNHEFFHEHHENISEDPANTEQKYEQYANNLIP